MRSASLPMHWRAALASVLPGAVLGAIVAWGAATTTARFVTDPVGPGGFLAFIAGGLILSAIVGGAEAVRSPDGSTRSSDSDDVVWWRLIATAIAISLYIALLPVVGFLPTTALFSAGMAALVGEKSWIALMIAGLGVPVTFWLLFGVVLGVELPGS